MKKFLPLFAVVAVLAVLGVLVARPSKAADSPVLPQAAVGTACYADQNQNVFCPLGNLNVPGGTGLPDGGKSLGNVNVGGTLTAATTVAGNVVPVAAGSGQTAQFDGGLFANSLDAYTATTLQLAGAGGTATTVAVGASASTTAVTVAGTAAATYTVGTAAHTGTTTVGNSTAGETVNIATGGPSTAVTNVVNIATGGTSTAVETVTVGSPLANVRSGFRQASQNLILRNSNAVVDCAGAGITPTVAQILGGTIYTCATAQNLTLPTAQGASGIVQGLPGTPAVGDVFYIHIAENHATNLLTLVAGTGGTIFGIAGTTNGSRNWECRVTSVTSGSETYTCY